MPTVSQIAASTAGGKLQEASKRKEEDKEKEEDEEEEEEENEEERNRLISVATARPRHPATDWEALRLWKPWKLAQNASWTNPAGRASAPDSARLPRGTAAPVIFAATSQYYNSVPAAKMAPMR